MNALVSFAKGLNTHKAGLVGILSSLAGLSVLGSDTAFTGLLDAAFPHAAASILRVLADVAVVAGAILSYLGKPKTVSA